MFTVLYEDARLIAFDKPSGLQSTGRTPDDDSALEGQVRAHYRDKHKHLELSAVHQLDKGTSGVLLFAKKRSALRQMHALFRERQVQKGYRLFTHGAPKGERFSERAPLRYDREQRRTISCTASGKKSTTHFELVQTLLNAQKATSYSELKARPLTGRTHQIRVHAAAASLPILGDVLYGQSDGFFRLALHAETLFFASDFFGEVRIECKVPEDLRAAFAKVCA